MEALLLAEGLKEIYRSFWASAKAYIQRCLNCHIHFLAFTEYDGSGLKGIVVILEGRGNRGCSGLALELWKILEVFQIS